MYSIHGFGEMIRDGVRIDAHARALQRAKGNVGDAADLLGIHRNTVARKMTEYRIKRT